MKKYKIKGFTLVEVLICVGIVGIIAAISIPALLSSTSSKALESQRKAFHSRMAQAFAQIKNLNSFKTDADSIMDLMVALSKNYKITNICKVGNFHHCGIPEKVYDYYSETADPTVFELRTADKLSLLNPNITLDKWSDIDTNAIAFRTANGESVLMHYNPDCKAKKDTAHNLVHSVCVNMIYDLNGKNKAPNSYGDDIGFLTVFYPASPSVVAPVVYNKSSFTGKFDEMLSNASSMDLLPPTLEETTAILVNQGLMHITQETGADGATWTSTYSESGDASKAWVAGITAGASLETTDTASAASHRYYLVKK